MRDVEAPGPDWLEGPENLRARKKPRAGGSPHPLQDRGLVLLPFRRPRFLYAPSVTGRSWAGTRAGGHAHGAAPSGPPQALKLLHSHFGGLAAFVLLSHARGSTAGAPSARQRPGSPAWVGAPRGKLGSRAVALACEGPRRGRREPLGEVWPCARAQMRGWGPAGTPGGTSVCPLNPPSPWQPQLWSKGQGPLRSSPGPTHPFGPRHQHTEGILEKGEAASLQATLRKGRYPAAPGGASHNVCKLPAGPGRVPPWRDAGLRRTWPLGG